MKDGQVAGSKTLSKIKFQNLQDKLPAGFFIFKNLIKLIVLFVLKTA